jgi:hypothetical protein
MTVKQRDQIGHKQSNVNFNRLKLTVTSSFKKKLTVIKQYNP